MDLTILGESQTNWTRACPSYLMNHTSQTKEVWKVYLGRDSKQALFDWNLVLMGKGRFSRDRLEPGKIGS